MSSYCTGSTSTEIYLSSLEAMRRNKRLSSLSFCSLAVGSKRVLISWVTAIQDKNPINVNLPDRGEASSMAIKSPQISGWIISNLWQHNFPIKTEAGFCSTSKYWSTLLFSLFWLILHKLSVAAVMKFSSFVDSFSTKGSECHDHCYIFQAALIKLL